MFEGIYVYLCIFEVIETAIVSCYGFQKTFTIMWNPLIKYGNQKVGPFLSIMNNISVFILPLTFI